jgi:hypothetical protein
MMAKAKNKQERYSMRGIPHLNFVLLFTLIEIGELRDLRKELSQREQKAVDSVIQSRFVYS